MPVIELDMLIAFINKADKYHEVAVKIFNDVVSGRLSNVAVPTSANMEYELVLRSRGYDGGGLKRYSIIQKHKESKRSTAKLRSKYGITYFDSLHAA